MVMNCCRNLDEMTSTLEAFLHLPRRVVNERVLSRVKPTLTQEFKNQVLNTRVDKNFHGRIYHSWSQSPLRYYMILPVPLLPLLARPKVPQPHPWKVVGGITIGCVGWIFQECSVQGAIQFFQGTLSLLQEDLFGVAEAT